MFALLNLDALVRSTTSSSGAKEVGSSVTANASADAEGEAKQSEPHDAFDDALRDLGELEAVLEVADKGPGPEMLLASPVIQQSELRTRSAELTTPIVGPDRRRGLEALDVEPPSKTSPVDHQVRTEVMRSADLSSKTVAATPLTEPRDLKLNSVDRVVVSTASSRAIEPGMQVLSRTEPDDSVRTSGIHEPFRAKLTGLSLESAVERRTRPDVTEQVLPTVKANVDVKTVADGPLISMPDGVVTTTTSPRGVAQPMSLEGVGERISRLVATDVREGSGPSPTSQALGTRALQLQLEPTTLGRVLVTIATGSEGLRVQIRTRTPEALTGLRAEMPQIHAQLQSVGFDVSTLTVVRADGETSVDWTNSRGSGGAGAFQLPTDGEGNSSARDNRSPLPSDVPSNDAANAADAEPQTARTGDIDNPVGGDLYV